MLRIIRDLFFPKPYDFSDRGRSRRAAEAGRVARRERPEPASGAQPESPAAAVAEA